MNKLHTLLIFTLLNFVAYGTPINVSELVTYAGEVNYYNLENETIQNIPAKKRQKTDLSKISILLNEVDILQEKINGRDCFRIIPKTLDKKLRPENLAHRTRFIDTETFVNAFLAHVRFSTKDINTLSAIRVIMYHKSPAKV